MFEMKGDNNNGYTLNEIDLIRKDGMVASKNQEGCCSSGLEKN